MLPDLGARPISDVINADLLSALRKIEARGITKRHGACGRQPAASFVTPWQSLAPARTQALCCAAH